MLTEAGEAWARRTEALRREQAAVDAQWLELGRRMLIRGFVGYWDQSRRRCLVQAPGSNRRPPAALQEEWVALIHKWERLEIEQRNLVQEFVL